MAAAITIDFERLYDFSDISEDLKDSFFNAESPDGKQTPLKVEISNDAHELLPDVYNLAFGPVDSKGRIDDKAMLSHKDHSKVFSTILLSGLTYLKSNPGHFLGVDGSDNRRAFLYFRVMQRNYNYLSQFFDLYGLKYYVRITRFGKLQYDNPFDFEDIFAYPDKIIREMRVEDHAMYNYFIFKVK